MLPQEHLTSNFNIRPNTYVPNTLFAFFFILNLFFGVDFGFTRYLEKKIQLISKCIWIIFSTVIIAVFVAATMSFSTPYLIYEHLTGLLQFLLNFFILFFTKYNFVDYVKDMNQISRDVPVLKKEILGIYTIAIAVLPVIGLYILSCIRCADPDNFDDLCHMYVPYFVFGIATISADSIYTIYILIYYYMYCYVKKYNDMVISSKIKMQKLQKDYMDLTVCFDKIMPLYDRLLSVELLLVVQRLMTVVYFLLASILIQSHWINYLLQVLYATPLIVHMIVPFIATEMLHAQLDNLKLNLNKKLLEEIDNTQINEIQKMLQYMETHHMQHKVWRFIPNDLRLPGALFSMCVTYLIVIIQFSHLYD